MDLVANPFHVDVKVEKDTHIPVVSLEQDMKVNGLLG